MTTRAAFIKAPWQTEVRDVMLPDAPQPQWVRVKIEACGICGTDATTARTAPDWQPFGHEIAGIIDAVGEGVTCLDPGQRVVLESSSACGACPRCRNARPDLCIGKAPNFWSQPALGFSDYIHAPAICCVPYDGLTPDIASLAEPCGVAFDMVQTADIALGETVCVVGPGPIALVALALAKARGAPRLGCIGRDPTQARMKLARDLGAETFTMDEALSGQLAETFDHFLITSPPATIPPLLPLLTYGGKATYIGIGTGDATITFDANTFHFRKLQLRASFASPALYFPAVLALLKSGTIPGEKLISHRFPLTEIQQAMETMRDAKNDILKVIVKP